MVAWLMDKRVFASFDYGMFHGIALRRDSSSRNKEEMCFEGDALQYPLHLSRNVRHPAQIFMPGLSFIVSGQVKDAIETVASVSFLRTVCDGLFDAPFDQKAKARFLKSVWKRDMRGYIRELAREHAVLAGHNEFVEVIPHRYDRIAEGHSGGRVIDTFVGPEAEGVRARVQLSAEFLMAAPVSYKLDGFYIVRGDVFDAMSPFLDRTAFLVSKVQL